MKKSFSVSLICGFLGIQGRLVHVEQLFDGNGDGRVVGVDLHDVSHHIPPFLCDGVHVGSVLAVGVLAALLISEENIGFLVPEDAVVAHAGLLDHLFQLRPDGGMALGILFLTTWFQVHLKSESFHNGLVFYKFSTGTS